MEHLFAPEEIEHLTHARIVIVGLGGVGGHCAEALCRCGIGKMVLVDQDVVQISNLNRQLVALSSTIGEPKAEVLAKRLLDINPSLQVQPILGTFTTADDLGIFDRSCDLVVDAIDSVKSKIALVLAAQSRGIPVVSAMGAGNKRDASRFEIADLYQTDECPLAKAMRKQGRAAGIKRLPCVFSREIPVQDTSGQSAPSSLSYVTASCGLLLSQLAITTLCEKRKLA